MADEILALAPISTILSTVPVKDPCLLARRVNQFTKLDPCLLARRVNQFDMLDPCLLARWVNQFDKLDPCLLARWVNQFDKLDAPQQELPRPRLSVPVTTAHWRQPSRKTLLQGSLVVETQTYRHAAARGP